MYCPFPAPQSALPGLVSRAPADTHRPVHAYAFQWLAIHISYLLHFGCHFNHEVCQEEEFGCVVHAAQL